MTRDKLISTIQAHRGLIVVALTARDDIIWVKAVKSDLLWSLTNIGDNQLEATYRAGEKTLYVDRCLD